jgi:hypothetical protein
MPEHALDPAGALAPAEGDAADELRQILARAAGHLVAVERQAVSALWSIAWRLEEHARALEGADA